MMGAVNHHLNKQSHKTFKHSLGGLRTRLQTMLSSLNSGHSQIGRPILDQMVYASWDHNSSETSGKDEACVIAAFD